jgi:hypothetical protein
MNINACNAHCKLQHGIQSVTKQCNCIKNVVNNLIKGQWERALTWKINELC